LDDTKAAILNTIDELQANDTIRYSEKILEEFMFLGVVELSNSDGSTPSRSGLINICTDGPTYMLNYFNTDVKFGDRLYLQLWMHPKNNKYFQFVPKIYSKLHEYIEFEIRGLMIPIGKYCVQKTIKPTQPVYVDICCGFENGSVSDVLLQERNNTFKIYRKNLTQ
jgi:hypothetical protein